MNDFHGYNKKRNFFEGWYFKHQKEKEFIAFIPGINIERDRKKSAFIQVLTNTNSYNINYLFSEFEVSKEKFQVRIGKSIFSDKGIDINIKNNDISIVGKINYENITPIILWDHLVLFHLWSAIMVF